MSCSRSVLSSALAHFPRLTFGKAGVALIAWLRNGSCAHRQKPAKKNGVECLTRQQREKERSLGGVVVVGATFTLCVFVVCRLQMHKSVVFLWRLFVLRSGEGENPLMHFLIIKAVLLQLGTWPSSFSNLIPLRFPWWSPPRVLIARLLSISSRTCPLTFPLTEALRLGRESKKKKENQLIPTAAAASPTRPSLMKQNVMNR